MGLSHAREHLLLVFVGQRAIHQRVAVPPSLDAVAPGGVAQAAAARGILRGCRDVHGVALRIHSLHHGGVLLHDFVLMLVVVLKDVEQSANDDVEAEEQQNLLDARTANQQHRHADGHQQQCVGKAAANHQHAEDGHRHTRDNHTGV